MEHHRPRGSASNPPGCQHSMILASQEPSVPSTTKTVDKLLYDRLRGVASRYLKQEAPGHPFEPTDLVNEVFVRMARSRTPVYFQTPDHFVAVSAIVMRHILVDHARSPTIFNRVRRKPLETDVWLEAEPLGDILAMRQALQRLARAKTRLYQIVELYAFKGFTFQEIGSTMSISTRTAERGWCQALGHLRKELDNKLNGSGAGRGWTRNPSDGRSAKRATAQCF